MRPRCHRGLRQAPGLTTSCKALGFNEAPVSPGFATPTVASFEGLFVEVSMRPRCHRGLRPAKSGCIKTGGYCFNEAPVSPGFATGKKK